MRLGRIPILSPGNPPLVQQCEGGLFWFLQKCRITSMKETQISALISKETKASLEGHVRATGTKKGHLIEEALLHHLQALRELPADVIVHPRITLTKASFKEIVERMEKGKSTPALRRLMRAGD